MPQRIKVLDKSVCEKIAAGEVVQNPASVVKELVENSIDAGATRIEVEIERGGKELIKVTDNGEGIEREDVGKAFMRHATSKLADEKDLARIETLGFRGEALAAVSAVSVINLTTRTKQSIEGTLYAIERNREVKCEETGCAPGTCIEVRDLFYNTPARLEYLKSDSHEASAVHDIVARLALARPDISFKLISGGRTLINTPGNRNLEDTIASVYGRNTLEDLFPVKCHDDGVAITGLVSKPHGSRSNRTYQSFFINGRFVRSRVIAKALEDAYRTLIMVNRYPMAVLYFKLDTEAVDVNVHPAKLEVKFREEERIRRAVYSCVRTALEKGRWIVRAPAKTPAVFSKPEKTSESPALQKNDQRVQKPRVVEETVEYNRIEMDNNIEGGSSKIPPMKVVGQFLSTFILAEGQDCVYIIDQHAAHERIMYEQLTGHLREGKMASQALLEPVVVDVSPIEMEAVRENLSLLSAIGYIIDEFGAGSLLVRAVPVFFGVPQSKEFLNEVISGLIRQGNKDSQGLKQDDIIRMACKKAVKANQRLSPSEMDNLIQELMKTDMPFTCPHGRPVFVTLTRYQLEKMFKRIV